jgi:tetratricopeptide (TPR) repeat protein
MAMSPTFLSAAGSQNYDPSKTGARPVQELASGPTDGVAYYQAKLRARELLDQEKAAEAEVLLERLTQDYPRDGQAWLWLGSAKDALGKYVEAAKANERAGSLIGWGFTQVPGYRAAVNYLKAGNRRAALDALRKDVFERRLPIRSDLYDMEELAVLRSDPEFLEIVGRPDSSSWSRDYGWRRDIDFLYEEVKRVNPDYHSAPLPVEFNQRYESLKRQVPQLSDEQILVSMNRMLAVLHQGHTWLRGLTNSRIPARRLPVNLWVFPEGIFIVDAIDQHKDLIGSRLVRIEDVPAGEALRRVNETQSVDGDNEYLLIGQSLLRLTPFLKGLGIVPSTETVRLTLRKATGEELNVALRTQASEFGLKLGPPPGSNPPLFLRNVRQAHWEQPLPEQDSLYVQLNQVAPGERETLEAFGLRLRSKLSESGAKNLILDMRHNTGGTTARYPQLLRTLIAFSQLPETQIYVLIGRATYSAAANLITDLERLANPIFVGEPSSQCCALYGDDSQFTLPFSKINGGVSAVKWNLSGNVFDGRREITPQVPVVLTAKDYFAGRDPALEAVFRIIKSRKASVAK